MFSLTGWKTTSLPSSCASQLNILKTWKHIQHSQKREASTFRKEEKVPQAAHRLQSGTASHQHNTVTLASTVRKHLWMGFKKSSWCTKYYFFGCWKTWWSIIAWAGSRQEQKGLALRSPAAGCCLLSALPSLHPIPGTWATCSLHGASGSKESPVPCPGE